MRAHGTNARYRLGPDIADTPGKGCRCEPCRAAAKAYDRERKDGVDPPFVPAGPARDHLAWLATQGVGLKTVAKRSGLSSGSLSKLVYGDYGRGTPPSRRIRRAAMEAILAVRPDDGAGGSRVPAGPVHAMVRRLVAAGVPRVRIAERLGQSRSLQLGDEWVTRRHATVIREMVAELDAGRLVTVRRSRHGDSPVTPPAPEAAPRETDDIDDLLLRMAEVLEERIDNRRWHADAACRGRPTWVWFPTRGDHRSVAKAKQVCAACPVRAECLATHADEDAGVWGGLTGAERRRLQAIDTPDIGEVGAA